MIEIQRDLDIFNLIKNNKGYLNKDTLKREYLQLKDKFRVNTSDCRRIYQLILLGYEYDDKYIVPEYQRDLVWTLKQKQNLIKSILYGNPIGDFLVKKEFGKDANGRPNELEIIWSIIDGQQRVNTIREFFSNKFKIDNKYFKDLNYWDAKNFIETEITLYSIENITLEQEIEIYLNRNIGGTKHSKKDIDKAKNFI